jgi:hypothetical protein
MSCNLAVLVLNWLIAAGVAAPAPQKESGPTKETCHYEVETILEPTADLAVYRIRVQTTDKRGVYLHLGDFTFEGSTRPEPAGKLHRADIVIVVGLEKPEQGARPRLERRIRFNGGAGANVDIADDVPADTHLAKVINLKGISGKEALCKKISIGELHGKELQVEVE